jgi:CheY-like chemotaxis protein
LNQKNLIGKSVLVVEDDPKIRNLVKIYLLKETIHLKRYNQNVPIYKLPLLPLKWGF